MKAYIEILCEAINSQLDVGSGFNLLKFENFTDPKIYLDICNYFNSILKNGDVKFIAKLSKEKFELWDSSGKNIKHLEQLDVNGYVEKEGNLTKWRNSSFGSETKATVIFLMGTELVEDKGGLEEFYNISPETIESYIGKNYSLLLKTLNFNYNEDENNIFNNIVESIFNYTTKDILSLSSALEDIDSSTNLNTLVKDILGNLYNDWSLPNIMKFDNDDLLKGRLKEKIGKAYKFSRRIGVDYQSDKKIEQIKNKLDKYYKDYEKEIINEFDERFPSYNNYAEFKEDFIKYIRGIDIDKVKEKLFQVDFTAIIEILNLKSKDRPTKNKIPVINGDPFRALFLPILIGYNNLEIDEKEQLKNIDINIEEIKLSGTKSKDNSELKNKWYKMCLFLGGIEKLIKGIYLTNNTGEELDINLKCDVEDGDGINIYPFSWKSTEELIKNSILVSGSNSETKSKILIEYSYKSELGDLLYTNEYEWQVYDDDIWFNAFSMFNSNKFLSIIDEGKALPIGVSDSIDEMIDSFSESELFLLINNRNIEYENVYSGFKPGSVESIISHNLAEQFAACFKEIRSNGFFNLYKDDNNKLTSLLSEYQNFNLKLKEKIQRKDIIEESTSLLSKCFMWLNNNEFKNKSILGAIIPPYHPVMLERIVERYRYLGNGFKEIFEQLKDPEQIKESRIVKRFDRFEQLSTITNSIEVLIGKSNHYIGNKRTLGYYTIFGENNENYYAANTIYNDFEDENSNSTVLSDITPVSQNISKIISDYIKTYPAKLDGVTIAFYEPSEYKEIIVGVNEVIKQFKKHDKITLKLVVYTSDYRCKGAAYFKYWIENNFNEEDNVFIEPSVRYVNIFDEGLDTVEQYLEKQLAECDLVFIKDIMSYRAIEPEDMSFVEQSVRLENRYPTVYLPMACNQEKSRKLLISQPQFMCSNSFSQLMVYVGSSIAKEDKYRIVKTVTLEEITEKLIKVLNKKASWVVIMDENIDKKIIEMAGCKIIAFSTGKGYFGELNSAISTKETYFVDLKRFLKSRLRKKFNWAMEDIEKAADVCINYAKEMDGAEIIKAINPSDEAINNYLAFLLTSKMINIKTCHADKYYIRKLISIDTHSHLFDEQVNFAYEDIKEKRPDFILLEIERDNNNLNLEENINISAKLIECKVAKQNDRHLEKAKEQVVAGFTRLSEIWNTGSNSVQMRYWFNQLYRLLVYNNDLNLNGEDLIKLNNKLSKINEGHFNINFDNEIYTYWLDVNVDNYIDEISESYNDVPIKNIVVDNRAIKLLLTNEVMERKSVTLEAIKVIEDTKVPDNGVDDVHGIDIGNETHPDGETPSVNISSPEQSDRKKVNSKTDKEIETNPLTTPDDVKSNSKWDVINVFKDYQNDNDEHEEEELKTKLAKLKQELELRKIKIFPKYYDIGPDIIRVSIELGVGVDYSQLIKHLDNIKIWLALDEEPLMFIESGYVKLDIVRSHRQVVSFKQAIEKTISHEDILKDREEKLYVLLGMDVLGNPKVLDLSDSNNPHLLVAGQTGSGKSVLLASMLTSMMVYYKPDELEMMLVDPKRVELTAFKKSPYTKCTATETEDVIKILDEVVEEMYRRYSLFEDAEVQNISGYNRVISPDNKLKRIMLVIDEYGVLIESDKEFVKKFESAIKKLSQLSRAAGIHLIICTQSPKAEIITTTIRNNLPARVGLKVADANASSLILDGSGGEKLLGKGDMLIKTAETSNNIRCKSPYISQEEIKALINFYKTT